MSMIYILEDDAPGQGSMNDQNCGASHAAPGGTFSGITSTNTTSSSYYGSSSQHGYGAAVQGYGTIKITPVGVEQHGAELEAGPIKTSATFIIVKTDGTTLEMHVKDKITPKEILNLTKFISIVGAGQHRRNVQWSTMISTMGIEGHFVSGRKQHEYEPNATSELYVMVYDAE